MDFASIAWFAMNKQTATSGMGVKVAGMPFSIVTQGTSGEYDKIHQQFDPNAKLWLLSPSSNLDNHKHQGMDEDDYGIEPGDSGQLSFKVQPNSADSITVDLIFEIHAIKEIDNGNGTKTYTEITATGDNAALIKQINSHLMLFENKDDNTNILSGFIPTDSNNKRVIRNVPFSADGPYMTIYWAWPKYLSNLIDDTNGVLIYDKDKDGSDNPAIGSGKTAMINYIVSNREGFFKDIPNDETLSDATMTSELEDMIRYGYYNSLYDGADMQIGKDIDYIILTLSAEQTSD